jgi:hypothetical protein
MIIWMLTDLITGLLQYTMTNNNSRITNAVLMARLEERLSGLKEQLKENKVIVKDNHKEVTELIHEQNEKIQSNSLKIAGIKRASIASGAGSGGLIAIGIEIIKQIFMR